MQSVLIVESDDRLMRERAHQLSLDGYEVQTAKADRQARLKLAEKPDALVLCDTGGGPQTLRLLRELRAGEILGADAPSPCSPSVLMTSPRRCACTATARTSLYPPAARRCW